MTLTNPSTGRLTPETVKRLEVLLGGDNEVEGLVLEFIQEKYGAKGLFYLPERIASEILLRPHDFLKAVKKWQTTPF